MAQFVPLKVNNDDDSWSDWVRKYPHEGSGIPVIYVIRADGEQLYGAVGNKKGDALPQLMVAALRQSGRILTPRDLQLLTRAVAEATTALEADDAAAACRQVRRIKKVGPLGEIGSFAQPAIEADSLVARLNDRGSGELAAAERLLAESDRPFEGIVALVSVKRIYDPLPQLKRPIAEAVRKVQKNPEFRDQLSPATALDRVHVILASRRDGKKKAIAALERIAQRHADTPAAEFAASWIERLQAGDDSPLPTNPHSAATDNRAERIDAGPSDETAGGFRTWTTADGKHRVEARLLDVLGDRVRLECRDGRTVIVPKKRLSKPDRDHVVSVSSTP